MSRLILTTGDPNGIGPEIILRIFGEGYGKKFNLFVTGNKKIFDYYSRLLRLDTIPGARIVEISLPGGFKVTPGKIDKRAGKFSGDCINAAVDLCMRNEIDAMITLPVNKHSLNTGGYNFPGHTEMLTKLTGSKDTAMILHSKKINVCPLTTHIPLKEVSKKLVQDKLIKKIITVNNSLVRDFKILSPRLALLGVNPHAGDGGEIGNEEIKILKPLIEKLRYAGFNIKGPFPADGFFASGYYKNFDVIFSIYHDQGLIPFKIFAFEKGVNFTAGLKIIRTSPDHGTAFDIAGSGKANISSTLEAIKLAYKLSKN